MSNQQAEFELTMKSFVAERDAALLSIAFIHQFDWPHPALYALAFVAGMCAASVL